MSYFAVHIVCPQPLADTISVMLGEQGCNGTWYENGRLIAYFSSNHYNSSAVHHLLESFNLVAEQITEKKEQNWNKLWEDNFKESIISRDIRVRAPFHVSKDYKHDIVILPKMAFGTGHHETTQLSAAALDKLDCKNKVVLDMGCGSGLLAILASQKGAKQVLAIDYDQNSVDNSIENVQLNNAQNVSVEHSDNVTHLTYKFDIIVSNIVKNINLSLLPQFAAKLKQNGTLILCGFLDKDLDQLKKEAMVHNLKLLNHATAKNWLQTTFTLNK